MKKVAVLFGMLFVAAQVHAADKVDFAKQVRPIFSETCYTCHGAKKQKGKLRLDSVEMINKGGKDGKVLEPGNPDQSEIFKRIILPKDSDDVMPPEGDLLPKEKTDLIKQWIAEGANFGDWKSDANAIAATTKPDEQSAAPKEVQLPQVAAADPVALDKLRQGGALAMPLAQNTNLVEVDLNLNGDRVDDGFLAQLEPLSQQVHTLNLARTKVSDDGLKAIENLKNLRRLHLENTKITDAGLTHLKTLTNLEYLNLYGTQVTDSVASELEGLKNLRALYLWQTKVTPDGVEKLKKALPQCQVNIGWEEPPKADPAKAEAK